MERNAVSVRLVNVIMHRSTKCIWRRVLVRTFEHHSLFEEEQPHGLGEEGQLSKQRLECMAAAGDIPHRAGAAQAWCTIEHTGDSTLAARSAWRKYFGKISSRNQGMRQRLELGWAAASHGVLTKFAIRNTHHPLGSRNRSIELVWLRSYELTGRRSWRVREAARTQGGRAAAE